MQGKKVQNKGTKRSQSGLDMPPYLTLKNNTYYFRQSVPAELRPLIGKREIKKSLGQSYPAAVRECKRYALVADDLIAQARTHLDSIPRDPFSKEGIRRTHRVTLTAVTPELESRLTNLVRASLLDTDRRKRIAGMSPEEFDEYSEHIDQAIKALRKQLAMGNLEPMLESTRIFLIGRGYVPEFSEADWRRVAYAVTQANLEAYEGIKKRQEGAIVTEADSEVLPSQYVIQNEGKTSAVAGRTVTWQTLYDIWVKECERRESTKASYLAAMKLFAEFCSKDPVEVSREDALAFRDFLRDEQRLAPGTVANKLGFVGTLYATGRNSPPLVKLLPENPFADIKVKRAQRGTAGEKRQPFTDDELKAIFSSSIYTKRKRPAGGAGEAAAWIPAIAYLTGMRLEEIALLTKRQFMTDAKGNHYIHVLDGKNENSADRDVPIHPALIRAGLLTYVQNCGERLFPKIQSKDEVQSSSFSKWWGRHLDKLGITAKSKVFHSFRHLFKDLCRNARIEDAVVDQICGHEPGTVGGKYGAGRRVDVLAEELRRVEPPIPLPVITG